MAVKTPDPLSRRERQIMDIVYRQARASAADVQEQLADPPTYSTVRALLRVLEDKGHLRHAVDGTRYVYAPTVPRARARRSALENVLQTFFDGSVERAALALAKMSDAALPASTMDALAERIRIAKEEGK